MNILKLVYSPDTHIQKHTQTHTDTLRSTGTGIALKLPAREIVPPATYKI